MSTKLNTNLNAIELNSAELDAIVGGASDPAMAAITRKLSELNAQIAANQLGKAKEVMPASTRKRAAGNSSS